MGSGARSRTAPASVAGAVEVAIVGMAAVFPQAPDLATFRANLRAGVDAITEVPADRWDPAFYDPAAAKTRPGDRMYCRRGGFVAPPAFEPTRFGIVPMAVADIEPDQLLALATAAAAIDDAGGPDRLGDRHRTGIVLGRGGYFNPGMARFVDRVRTANQLAATLRELLPELSDDQIDGVRRSFADSHGPLREESGIDLMVPNLVASRTANRLDLGGPAYTVDAACASSLIAVDHAVRELASGRCDVVLAGGVHHCHDITFWSGFNLLGALSPSERIRPFHRHADGILIGEGTGILVLKRLADAADDRVYAVIKGVGVAGDGRSSSLMAPRSEGQVAAMRQAWAGAGLDPTEPGAVGLVEAHGTATVAGDATELASLAEVFGPPRDGPDIGLGSVKSMIGHAMPACGSAGLIKAALALHDGLLPPTLHCEEPHPAMEGTRFAPVTGAREWTGEHPRRAAVNAFGFGGINAHVVLAELPPAPAVEAPLVVRQGAHRERVLLLAGADAAELAVQLEASDAELLDRDDSVAPPTGGPARLAVVAPDAKRLALARKITARGTGWQGRNDVWFSTAPLLAAGPDGRPAGGVAFLFPGLEQVFEPRVEDVAAHFGLPPVRSAADAGLGRRGLELAAVGRLLDAALRALGIQPDAVAGHSIGEWSALIASGAAPFEEFADSTRAFDAAPAGPDVVFAVLGCGADTALDAISGLDQVTLSHDNCPNQAIICGAEAQIDRALARLRERGVTGNVLPFRSGFHTPYLEPHLGPTREFVANLSLRRPDLPLWSATTAGRYPEDPDAVRALLLRNLVEPVRFGPLIQRLHAAGIRAFVQVGTGSLPGFVEDTLSTPAVPHLSISANVPKRSGLAQLRRVAAALWSEGAAPRFHRLDVPVDDSEPAPHPERSAAPAPATREGRSPEGPAPGQQGPARAERPGLPLSLGTPLVRLAEAANLEFGARAGAAASVPPDQPGPTRAPVTTRVPAASTNAAPPNDLVHREFDALLAETESAAAAVIAAWRASPPGQATAAPAAQPPGAAEPPGLRSATRHRVMSLTTDPHLADHCLLQAPDGAPDADRFPIVPMTATVGLLADAAADLIPERVVTGLRGVRALRPLAVEPEITLILEAIEKPRGDGELTVVGVVLDGRVGGGPRETYARATVLMADDYPPVPALREPPLSGERRAEIDATALYRDRWMFHGPAYQGVLELTGIADDGARGRLRSLPAPGALLDAAGQLLGYWVATQPDNGLVLPATIGSISFYGPAPEPGTDLDAVVRVRSATPEEAVADLDLRTVSPEGAGRLWCHITGWTDRRLEGDAVTIEAFRHPAHALLAQPQTGTWLLLVEPWADPVARDLVARQYLSPDERASLDQRNPRAARHHLLGRIAAKDAVRHHLRAGGAGPIFPAEIRIGNDGAGRPYATGAGSDGLALSLAHSGPFAAALVGPPGTSVGVDVELIEDAPAEAALLTAGERELLEGLCPPGTEPAGRACWVARFWTAKEAVAKAAGTGLGGRPARFVVTRVENDRLLVVVEGEARWVTTRSGDDPVPYAVGWTTEYDILGAGEGSSTA